jgi:hypothetical protein
MIERTTTLAWMFVVLAASPAHGADGAEPADAAKPLLFGAQSRIEVDAEGKVVAIEAAPGLPAAVNTALEQNLRKLRFEPATKDGRAVGGVTYARQEACAIPEGGQYRMAVKFLGNGPGYAEGGGRLAAPRWPTSGPTTGPVEVKLVYRVGPDGEITVESTDLVSGRNRVAQDFVSASRQWLDGRRGKPEFLDGQPVSTRMSTTVKFMPSVTFTGSNARRQAEAYGKAERARQEQARIAASDACSLAARPPDGTPVQVALDSPFKPLPVH